jgi:nucleoside-diphosphate kinase
MALERSFAMLKPGIVQRRLVGEVIARLERKGLVLIGIKMLHIDRSLAETHYAEHVGKDFYEPLVSYTISGPVVAMVVQGDDAISILRRLCGPTKVDEAQPGTIRGDLAFHTRKNVIHASDSLASAEREIGLFFRDNELVVWEDGNHDWF